MSSSASYICNSIFDFCVILQKHTKLCMVERDFQGQHGKENLSKKIILMLPIDGSVWKLPEAVRQPCAEFIIFLYVFTDNYHS